MKNPSAADHEDRQVVAVPRWMMHECGGDPRDAMVLAQIAFWYQPPLDGSREHRAALVVHRFDSDWCALVDADLAEQLGMTRSQVQRARSALAKRGLIETRTAKVDGERRTLVRPVIAGKREYAHRPDNDGSLSAETRNGSKRENARTRARATPLVEDQSGDQEPLAAHAAEGGQLFPGADPPSPTPDDLLKARAREIAQTVWERKNPKPAGKGAFLGLVSVAHALLVAEHDIDVVVEGMTAASPVTIRAVEFAIANKQPRRHQPDAGIMTDRDAPAGRIDL